MASSQTPVQRCLSNISCETDKFCCCSLRAGVLVLAVLYTVNASLAFASEAALYLGVLNAISGNLPPGTKLEDPKLQGGLIVVGLWYLSGAICGFLSGCKRDLRAATGFYTVTAVDLVLAIALGALSFFMGAPFNALVAQVPALLLNIYLVVVVRSWRNQLLREAGKGPGSASRGGVEGMGGAGGGQGVDGAAAGGQGLGARDELDVDEEDLDLDLEAPAPSSVGASKVQGAGSAAAAPGGATAPGVGRGRGSPTKVAKAQGDDD